MNCFYLLPKLNNLHPKLKIKLPFLNASICVSQVYHYTRGLEVIRHPRFYAMPLQSEANKPDTINEIEHFS